MAEKLAKAVNRLTAKALTNFLKKTPAKSSDAAIKNPERLALSGAIKMGKTR